MAGRQGHRGTVVAVPPGHRGVIRLSRRTPFGARTRDLRYPCRRSPMEGVYSAEAVIDNGRFGTRTIRFETGAWPARPQGRLRPTLTTRPWSCRRPPRRSAPRRRSTSSRSPSTSKNACTPRDASPARSSAGRAVPPRTRSSPAASSTGRCGRPSRRGCATRSRSSRRSWRCTRTTSTTSSPSTPRRCPPSLPDCRSPVPSAACGWRWSKASGWRFPRTRSWPTPRSTWSWPAGCWTTATSRS